MTREQQEKVIATIKPREIKLNLTDADCERVMELCGQHSISMSQLIENFISDLVGGTYSNGSDEEDCASKWFSRCWFGLFPQETLLKNFLDNGYDVEEFLSIWDLLQSGREDLESYKQCPEQWDEEAVGYLNDDLEYWEKMYKDYTEEYLREYPEADMEQEIASVRMWFDQKEALVKGRT